MYCVDFFDGKAYGAKLQQFVRSQGSESPRSLRRNPGIQRQVRGAKRLRSVDQQDRSEVKSPSCTEPCSEPAWLQLSPRPTRISSTSGTRAPMFQLCGRTLNPRSRDATRIVCVHFLESATGRCVEEKCVFLRKCQAVERRGRTAEMEAASK